MGSRRIGERPEYLMPRLVRIKRRHLVSPSCTLVNHQTRKHKKMMSGTTRQTARITVVFEVGQQYGVSYGQQVGGFVAVQALYSQHADVVPSAESQQ